MATLKEYITDPKTGKPIRGAVQRCAEYCGVSRITIDRHLYGDAVKVETLRKIQDFVHSGGEMKHKHGRAKLPPELKLRNTRMERAKQLREAAAMLTESAAELENA